MNPGTYWVRASVEDHETGTIYSDAYAFVIEETPEHHFSDEFDIQSISVTGETVTVAVENKSGFGGTLLLAAYKADGRLIAVATADVEETREIKVTLNTSEADHVSAFIVDSLDSMRPVCAKYDQPITESTE